MVWGQLAIHMEENEIRISTPVIRTKKKKKNEKERKKTDGLNTKCKQIKTEILEEKQRIRKEIGKAGGPEVIFKKSNIFIYIK